MSNTVVVRTSGFVLLAVGYRKSDDMLTMNCNAQGNIYAQIIDRIIDAAKNDFEEGGYDQSTLVDLKEVSRGPADDTLLTCSVFVFISTVISNHAATHFGSKMVAVPSLWCIAGTCQPRSASGSLGPPEAGGAVAVLCSSGAAASI